MSFEVRYVTEEYDELCDSIVLAQKKISGTKPISHEKYLEIKKSASDLIKIGYFENNKLISWIIVAFRESKMRGKFWVIAGLFTTNFEERFSFARPEFGLIFKRAFEIAEEKGYFQYFYCVSEKIERVYERQWKKNPWGFNGRYDLITLDIVPANTQPKYELYWKLMGQELKPDNMVIKARILKNYDPHTK